MYASTMLVKSQVADHELDVIPLIEKIVDGHTSVSKCFERKLNGVHRL